MPSLAGGLQGLTAQGGCWGDTLEGGLPSQLWIATRYAWQSARHNQLPASQPQPGGQLAAAAGEGLLARAAGWRGAAGTAAALPRVPVPTHPGSQQKNAGRASGGWRRRSPPRCAWAWHWLVEASALINEVSEQCRGLLRAKYFWHASMTEAGCI